MQISLVSKNKTFAKNPEYKNWGEKLDQAIRLFKKMDWSKVNQVKLFNRKIDALSHLILENDHPEDLAEELKIRRMVKRRLDAMDACQRGCCFNLQQANNEGIQYIHHLQERLGRTSKIVSIFESLKEPEEDLLLYHVPSLMQQLYDLAAFDGFFFGVPIVRDFELKTEQLPNYVSVYIQRLRSHLEEPAAWQRQEYEGYFSCMKSLVEEIEKKNQSPRAVRTEFKKALKTEDLTSMEGIKKLYVAFVEAAYAVKDSTGKTSFLKGYIAQKPELGIRLSLEPIRKATTSAALRNEIRHQIQTMAEIFAGDQAGSQLRGFEKTGLQYEAYRMKRAVEEFHRGNLFNVIEKKKVQSEHTEEYKAEVKQVEYFLNQKLFRKLGFFICRQPRFDTVFQEYKNNQKDLSSSVVFAILAKGRDEPINFVVRDDGSVTSFRSNNFDEQEEYAGFKHLLDGLDLLPAIEKLLPPKKRVKIAPGSPVKNKS